jgi:hypothetical protein
MDAPGVVTSPQGAPRGAPRGQEGVNAGPGDGEPDQPPALLTWSELWDSRCGSCCMRSIAVGAPMRADPPPSGPPAQAPCWRGGSTRCGGRRQRAGAAARLARASQAAWLCQAPAARAAASQHRLARPASSRPSPRCRRGCASRAGGAWHSEASVSCTAACARRRNLPYLHAPGRLGAMRPGRCCPHAACAPTHACLRQRLAATLLAPLMPAGSRNAP